jgi:hypothetical protein
MDTNTLTLSGLCLVIVLLLALIVKMIWNRVNGRDDLDGLL